MDIQFKLLSVVFDDILCKSCKNWSCVVLEEVGEQLLWEVVMNLEVPEQILDHLVCSFQGEVLA
jgi:hypothetical protein